MKTTILQPTYMPWLGYFEMIDYCDQYVVFDHVQFETKSWQHRNRIKGPNGEVLLTIPLRSDGRQDVQICDKRIDNGQQWRKKHLKSMKIAYGKAPHFKEYFPHIQSVIERQHELVAELTTELIEYFIKVLGINTTIVRSSKVLTKSDSLLGKTEKVVNLCKAVGATMLYDGAAARNFLEIEQFEAEGIGLVFQDYRHPTYRQVGRDFLPYIGIVDLLFNHGSRSLQIIRAGRGEVRGQQA